jgi:hypothetical protein
MKRFVILGLSTIVFFGMTIQGVRAENFFDALSKSLSALGGLSDEKPQGPSIEEQIVKTTSTRFTDEVKMGLVEFNITTGEGQEDIPEEKQKNMSSQWTEYLQEKILNEISNKQLFSKLHVIERNSLNSIYEEKKFQLTGLTDKTATEIGGLAGLNVVLLGNAKFTADSIQLSVKIVNVNNGEILGIAKQQMKKKTTTLYNSTLNMKASSAYPVSLNISGNGELKIRVDVVRGNPIDVFLINSKDWDNVTNALFKHQGFRAYQDFTMHSTKQYSKSANMSYGNYTLVLYDKTKGILSQPSSDVRVTAMFSRK